MLRELHQVLLEMHDSVTPLAGAQGAGVRLDSLELALPLDMVAVLRGGGCTLLADVARNHADAPWHGRPTRLRLRLAAAPATDPVEPGDE